MTRGERSLAPRPPRYLDRVPYALENAMTQWQEGEHRLRVSPPAEQAHLEDIVQAVIEELRRRLGSKFMVGELVDLYYEGTDWAEDVAQRRSTGADTSAVVDAAFGRYARGAADFAGGRTRFAG